MEPSPTHPEAMTHNQLIFELDSLSTELDKVRRDLNFIEHTVATIEALVSRVMTRTSQFEHLVLHEVQNDLRFVENRISTSSIHVKNLYSGVKGLTEEAITALELPQAPLTPTDSRMEEIMIWYEDRA